MPDDVIAAWSGIRPLARQLSSGDVGSASREHTIERGRHGVIHVTGGKLTTYREMASQVVDQFAGPEAKHDRTSIIPLPGGERPLDVVRVEATEVIDDAVVVEHLIRSYGTRWRDVWLLAESDPALKQRVSSSHTVIRAEFVYAMQHEFAMTLGDLLIRRTHLAFETPDQAQAVAEDLPNILLFPGVDRDALLNEYESEVRRTFEIE